MEVKIFKSFNYYALKHNTFRPIGRSHVPPSITKRINPYKTHTPVQAEALSASIGNGA